MRIWKYDPHEDAGHWVLQSLANTGISGAATPNGTWPAYARYASTRMTGCFPHRECYDDADVRYVNYFWDGRAVHFFPRAGYAFPPKQWLRGTPFERRKKGFRMDPHWHAGDDSAVRSTKGARRFFQYTRG